MSDADSTVLQPTSVPTRLPAGGSRTRLGGLIAGLDRLDPILALPPYPEAAEPGVVFGKYRLRTRLGSGACGTVVLADDTSLGRPVVVKVPQPVVLSDPESRGRFVREARAAGVLDHPGIVPVFEAGEVGGLPYIAAGFVPGPTLAAWLAGRGRVEPGEAARLVRSLARAVHHAHERGVLHCDLKPGNVLLAPAPGGGPPEPVVTDFGMARILTDDPTLTRTFEQSGTPLYMSPEQARGDRRALTARTDIHALGVILYELLTGRPPFAAEASPQVLERVRTASPPCPGAANPAAPRDLRAVCLRCLEKEPRDRYESAAALAKDLDNYLGGFPVEARRVGPATRVARLARRHPAGTAAVVAFAALLAGLGVLAAAHWAAGVQHDAELKEAAASRAAADDRAAAGEFVAALERVRRRRAQLDPNWPTDNLTDLRHLAASRVAADHLAVLRTEAAAALGATELGPHRLTAEGFRAYAPAFSPDGKFLALGCWATDLLGTCRVVVVEVATGVEARTLTFAPDRAWMRRLGEARTTDGCRAIAWSPDGRWVVAGTRSGRVVRWDLRRPNPQPEGWAHAAPGAGPTAEAVAGLAFTPAGRVLVSVGHGAAVGWRVEPEAGETWPEVFRRGAGAARLVRPARADAPVFVLTAGSQGFRVLDKKPWVRPAPLPDCDAAGPWGQWFAGTVPTGHHLQLFSGTGPAVPGGAFRMPGDDRAEDGGITDVVVRPGGDLIVTTAEHRQHLKVWAVVGGELVAARTLDRGSLRAAFSPDGGTLAVCGEAGTFLYDLRGRGVCRAVGLGPAPLADADLTPDGRSGATIAAAGDENNRVRVARWAPEGPPEVAWEAEPGNGSNRLIALAPDGSWLAVPSGNGVRVRPLPFSASQAAFATQNLRDLRADTSGRLWSTGGGGVQGWEVLRPWPFGGNVLVPALGVAKKSGGIYDCVAPGTAGVWVGRTGDGVVRRYPRTLDPPAPAFDPADRTHRPFDTGVLGLAQAADGRRVLAGGRTGGVTVIDADTGEDEVSIPDAHRDAVPAAAFLPRGWFATGSRCRTVKVWDPAGGLVLTLPQTRPVRRVFVSADGERLTVLAEGERGLRQWNLPALRAGLAEAGIDPGLP